MYVGAVIPQVARFVGRQPLAFAVGTAGVALGGLAVLRLAQRTGEMPPDARSSVQPVGPTRLRTDPVEHDGAPVHEKVLVMLFTNTNVGIRDGLLGAHTVRASVAQDQVDSTLEVLGRYEDSVYEWSGGAVDVDVDYAIVDRPVDSLTGTSYGPALWTGDAGADAQHYAANGGYRSVMTVWRADDGPQSIMQVSGLSLYDDARQQEVMTIPLPRSGKDWDSANPEQIFVHEWLHGVERAAERVGSPIPDLHDTGRFGITADPDSSWTNWYRHYMTGDLTDEQGHKVGLSPEVWQRVLGVRRS